MRMAFVSSTESSLLSRMLIRSCLASSLSLKGAITVAGNPIRYLLLTRQRSWFSKVSSRKHVESSGDDSDCTGWMALKNGDVGVLLKNAFFSAVFNASV